MLTTPDEDIAPASFEAFATAGPDAADHLGETVTARDAVTDEVLATSSRPRHLVRGRDARRWVRLASADPFPHRLHAATHPK
jgi:hypothetical protein